MTRPYRRAGLIFVFLYALISGGGAAEQGPAPPKESDRCPVCGMFVHKYPKWVAHVLFKDSSYAVFDGAKDMFKYYFDMPRYQPDKDTGDIARIYVTDYYSVELIDAEHAYYVIGSDVYGPMGHELIPLKGRQAADEFMLDHHGSAVVTFPEVTRDLLQRLGRQ